MIHYKLAILGDVGVGKTALIIRLCLDHFIEIYEPIIGDSYWKELTINCQSYMVEVLDTSGQEEYTTLQDQCIRDGQGFVLVYSTSSRESFFRIQKYRDQIQRVKELLASLPSSSHSIMPTAGPMSLVLVMLVGNKSDEAMGREVSTQEGHSLARKLGYEFVEASAKNRINVEKAFYDVVRLLRLQRRQSVQQLPIRTGTHRRGKKCVIL